MEILPKISNPVLKLCDSLRVKRPFLNAQLLLHKQVRIELPVFSIQIFVNPDQMEILFCTFSKRLIIGSLLVDDNKSLLVEHDGFAQTREVLFAFLFFGLEVIDLDALVLVGCHQLLDVVDEGLFH